MSIAKLAAVAIFCAGCSAAQSSAASAGSLAAQTTLPISFTRTISADHVKTGDVVTARTLQTIRLADGREVKAGTRVLGHISEAQPFFFDKTPYAKQRQAALGVQFDSLVTPQGKRIPLHVYVRAIADSFATTAAHEPRPSDEDSLHSTTQVGGDILTPSQDEVTNAHGDVVGYNKRNGVYAHLIASTGAGGVRCDESSTEQSMAHFSASACGLYGFGDLALASTGYASNFSSLTLVSKRRSPEISRGSTALLEVLPPTSLATSSR